MRWAMRGKSCFLSSRSQWSGLSIDDRLRSLGAHAKRRAAGHCWRGDAGVSRTVFVVGTFGATAMIASARSPLAILAVVVLASITAHSEPNHEARSDLGGIPWSMLPILPPAEFDRPFAGQLTITRLATENEVRAMCSGANFNFGRAMGCNLRYGDS